jgi:glucose-1-phosphate cytidylyltransferase
MTYGDGLADVDIGELIRFHGRRSTLATVTAVQPPGRFGSLDISDDLIRRFQEKPVGDGGWIK